VRGSGIPIRSVRPIRVDPACEHAGVRLVFVPGFTQAADCWLPVIDRLPGDWDAITIDVPEGLDFDATAAGIGVRGGRATYVGYSMGARLCLALALERPDLVDQLVLVSGSAGIADPHERATRRAADDQLAHQAERDGVDAFLERWLAQPLFASLDRDQARIDERRRVNSVERITHQLRALGQGVQPSLWDRLSELKMPVVLVTGAYDRKYRDLAAAMASAIGSSTRAITVDNAGHAVHLEQPAALAEILRREL
jgi:2-succinyl-6-hydroxy-2,4-cyclohexadiene-1-carboxylate synthase